MTDPAIIAASYAAERNYSHNPDDVIDPSGAVGAWGTAKESTTELVDLSGNGNIADIHGAMPTEGFIQGRRFTAANSNHLDCGNDASLNLNDNITIEILVSRNNDLSSLIAKGSTSSHFTQFYVGGSANKINGNFRGNELTGNTVLDANTLYYIVAIYSESNDTMEFFLNGVSDGKRIDATLNLVSSTDEVVTIGTRYYGTTHTYFNGSIYLVGIHEHRKLEEKIKQDFNTLARLPFWSVNYTDYPDNVTEYTDNLPYSSSIISSGTFKIDDDKLQCVSAGTMTYSASYDFDGSEYIKVEIDGVEYAGTGTITQGNTTVSVAQGSNKVTIQMGTGDTIDDEINIQFREEVN